VAAFNSYPPGNLPADVELVGTVTEPVPDRRPGGSRRKARKRAVDFLFEAEVRDVDPVTMAQERMAAARDDRSATPVSPYTLTLVAGVAENLDGLDEVISAHLRGWRLDRLPAVDRAVLRLAVWELLHASDVPPMVAVDEAVELAKQLSTDDSPGYVNGVLNQVALLAPSRGPGAGQASPGLAP